MGRIAAAVAMHRVEVDHGCYLLAELDRRGLSERDVLAYIQDQLTASGLAADGTGP